MLSYPDYASIIRITSINNQLIIRCYNENKLKRSINNTFRTISTHVYVNNQNLKTNAHSFLNSTRRLKTRWYRAYTDKKNMDYLN